MSVARSLLGLLCSVLFVVGCTASIPGIGDGAAALDGAALDGAAVQDGAVAPDVGVPVDTDACVPACAGKDCGTDGCGGNCGRCGDDDLCNDTVGICVPKGDYGATCNEDRACLHGNCVDGYCCNTSCTGQCEACNVSAAEGTCTVAIGAPHGSRMACAGSDVCAGACDGASRIACSYPTSVVQCRWASCSEATKTLGAYCDGVGACPTVIDTCAPYICASATACKTICDDTDDDCAAGYYCGSGGETCLPKGDYGAICNEDHECLHGNCVDNYCCNSDCKGPCGACDLAGYEGTCTATLVPPKLYTGCAGGGTCGGTCDGSNVACLYPPSGLGCGQTCSGGMQTLAGSCDGVGACSGATHACFPYACGATVCKTTCTTDDDCVSHATCAAGGVCQMAPWTLVGTKTDFTLLSSWGSAVAGIGSRIYLQQSVNQGTPPPVTLFDTTDGTFTTYPAAGNPDIYGGGYGGYVVPAVGKLYYFGNTARLFDPETPGWRNLPSCAMDMLRGEMAMGAVGTILYMAGGRNDATVLTSFDTANNTCTATGLASPPGDVYFGAGGAANGYFYVLGGENGFNKTYRYAPIDDSWETLADTPFYAGYQWAAHWRGKLALRYNNLIHTFDPVNGTWDTATISIPSELHNPKLAVTGDSGSENLFVVGDDGSNLLIYYIGP